MNKCTRLNHWWIKCWFQRKIFLLIDLKAFNCIIMMSIMITYIQDFNGVDCFGQKFNDICNWLGFESWCHWYLSLYYCSWSQTRMHYCQWFRLLRRHQKVLCLQHTSGIYVLVGNSNTGLINLPFGSGYVWMMSRHWNSCMCTILFIICDEQGFGIQAVSSTVGFFP